MKLFIEYCPNCKCIGDIDKEQKEGKVSIICSECNHHYYRKKSD